MGPLCAQMVLLKHTCSMKALAAAVGTRRKQCSQSVATQNELPRKVHEPDIHSQLGSRCIKNRCVHLFHAGLGEVTMQNFVSTKHRRTKPQMSTNHRARIPFFVSLRTVSGSWARTTGWVGPHASVKAVRTVSCAGV